MATPSEILRDLLRERDIKAAQLGREMGYKNAYGSVKKWLDGTNFGPDVQRKVADHLKLPPDYFGEPDKAKRRAADAARVFERFAATELGQTMDAEERRVLSSTSFDGELRPNIAYYQAALLAMRGHLTREQARKSAELSNAIDESNTAQQERKR